MQAQGYRIAENHRLVSMPPERVSEEWKSGGAGYWLDIQGSCHEALEHYLGELEIDPILAQRVRRRVGALTEQMDRNADAVEIEQLLEEKAAVRQLETLDEESSPVYAMLKVADNDQLNLSDLGAYYQVVLSNTAFLTRIVERLEARLEDLHQRFVLNAQEKTNQRLAFLTVISAIFLPLTLLAGIYGMNFEVMPELGLPFAYPAALGVMVAIAFGMWRFFKRKGWFD